MNATPLSRPLSIVGLCASLLAQAPPPLLASVEDVLPAATYACVRVGGLQACAEATGGLPATVAVRQFLGRLPAAVRAEHLDRHLDEGADHVRELLAGIGVGPAEVRALLQRPMVLALGRLTIEGMGPSVALVVDEGEGRGSIGRLAAKFGFGDAGDQALERELGGPPVKGLQRPGWPPLFLASFDRFAVLTNSRGYLRDLAAVARGQERSLAQESRLAEVRARLPQPALASLFIDAHTVTGMLDPHLPYETAQLAAALGIGHLDNVYLGTTATPLGGCDVLHLGVLGSERGVAKALTAAPADLGFAAACSQNTVAFGCGSFDLPAVIDAFERFTALLPASVQRQVQRNLSRGLRRGLEEFGTTPQEADAMLRAFGNQLGFAIALEKGAVPKPELVVSVAVRDAQRVAPLLAALEARAVEAAGVEWKARKVGEREVRFCTLQAPGVPFQLSPCYALDGGSLLIGSDVNGLVRALRQREKPEASLAAQPDFAAMAKDCAGASGLLHLRLFRAAELGWRSVETMAYPQLDAHRDEVGFGSDALPDAEGMAKALGTSTIAMHVDDAGITVRSHGTLAFGALLAALGTVADDVLDRASGRVY